MRFNAISESYIIISKKPRRDALVHKLFSILIIVLFLIQGMVINAASLDESSTKFNPTDRVWAITDVKVRSDPGLSSNQINSLANGNSMMKGGMGTVRDGPISKDSYSWWKIDYDIGITGWSAENYLELAPKGPTQPDNFAKWSDDAIKWASDENRLNSKAWNGECLRFVSNAFRQKDSKGESGYESAANAARDLYRFDQEQGGWLNAPRGAIIFFNGKGTNRDGHVGIYIRNNNIINAYGIVEKIAVSDIVAKTDVGEYIGWSYPPEAWRPREANTKSQSTQPTETPGTPALEEQTGDFKDEQGDDERDFVSRVIFAEAGPSCSDNERELVASVILGRIGHLGFGKGNLKTMYDVVKQPNAFSCIDDPKNKNWAKSADVNKLTAAEKLIWDKCYSLASGNFQQQYGRSGQPLVYYHDKTISKPDSWDNKYWSAVKELDTDHFIFYSVTEASGINSRQKDDETKGEEANKALRSRESSEGDITASSMRINETIGGFQVSFPARNDLSFMANAWGGPEILEGDYGPFQPMFSKISLPKSIYIVAGIYTDGIEFGCAILDFREQHSYSHENMEEFLDWESYSYAKISDAVIDNQNAVILKNDDNSEYAAVYWLDEAGGRASKLVVLVSTEPQERKALDFLETVRVKEI